MPSSSSPTPEKEVARIESVAQETKKEWMRYKKWYLIASVSAVAIDGVVGMFSGELELFFITVTIMLMGLNWMRIWHKMQRAFMQQFASRNGFQFEANGESKHRTGKLFAHKYVNDTTNVVRGSYLGHPFELFNYHYKVGEGKHATNYNATVLQYTFAGLVPQFSLTERMDGLSVIHRMALGQRVLELEGDLHKYFVVYVKELHEIEMLEVLTPEIMAFLIDHGCKLSFEFVGRNLFIYQDHVIGKREELEAFFGLTRLLVDRINHRIERLHDDVEAITAVSKKRS